MTGPLRFPPPVKLESNDPAPRKPDHASRIGYLLGSLFVLVVGLGVAGLIVIGFIAACVALARAFM